MLSLDVRPCVRPSVRHVPVFYRNDSTFVIVSSADDRTIIVVLCSPGSKGSKFERGGHGMVYFSNATFQLAWTLGIYV